MSPLLQPKDSPLFFSRVGKVARLPQGMKGREKEKEGEACHITAASTEKGIALLSPSLPKKKGGATNHALRRGEGRGRHSLAPSYAFILRGRGTVTFST